MLSAVLIALALQGNAAPAAPPQPPANHPSWLRGPSTNDMGRTYPPRAAKYGVGGQAKLKCVVDTDGFLNNCRVLEESPPGWGFGDSTIMLSRTMVMTPGYRAAINIPVIWKPVAGMYRYLAGSDLGHLTRPQFLSAPGPGDVAAAYPKEGRGVNGYAVLNCDVSRSSGRFGRCTSVFEQPTGRGFGKAALSLASKFEVRVPDLEKRQALGIWTEFPVRLPAPRAGEATTLDINNPVWLTEADPAALAELVPAAAKAKGLDGSYGFADCAAHGDGSLTDCRADEGSDGGLAAAAAKAALKMQLSVWTGDGQPVDGARVRVRILFGPDTEDARAAADIEEALQINPNSTAALLDRSNIRLDHEDYDGAIADLTRAITVDPNYQLGFYARGYAWQLKGNYERSIADLDHALALDPKCFKCFLARGYTRNLQGGDADRALADFDHALQLSPNDPAALAGRSGAWVDKGEIAQAIADADKAIGLDPNFATAYGARCWARAIGGVDLDQALVDCNRAVKLDPKEWNFLDSRAAAHLKRGDFAEAVADEDSAIAASSGHAEALYVRGLAKKHLGRQAEGAADLAAAAALDPKIADRYAKWGMAPQ